MNAPPQVVAAPDSGAVLVFAPHADDEVIGCGGTLSLHARQGDAVRVVVVFDGAAGVSARHGARDRRADIRRREALGGGAVLGITDYEFWDYPEGHLPRPGELAHGAERLADLVSRLAPATIYAPWRGEDHRDHAVLSRAVRSALELAGFRGRAWGYEVWTPLVPTRVVDVTAQAELKNKALCVHASQIELNDIAHRAMGLAAYRSMYLGGGGRYAEAFAELGPAEVEEAP